jgi:hypothetical protein
MAARLFQAEDFLIEFDRFLEVVHPIARMQQLPYSHAPQHTNAKESRKAAPFALPQTAFLRLHQTLNFEL